MILAEPIQITRRIAHEFERLDIGIDLCQKGDLAGAIKAYKTAINNYPSTDRYHHNETLNDAISINS